MTLLWQIALLGSAWFLAIGVWLRAAHLNCRFYADLSCDWAERGRFYDGQLANLKLAAKTTDASTEPLIKFTFHFLSQHYVESSDSAWMWADRYRSRIPIGVRAWYLRTTS
jgi:hypothetical protein